MSDRSRYQHAVLQAMNIPQWRSNLANQTSSAESPDAQVVSEQVPQVPTEQSVELRNPLSDSVLSDIDIALVSVVKTTADLQWNVTEQASFSVDSGVITLNSNNAVLTAEQKRQIWQVISQ